MEEHLKKIQDDVDAMNKTLDTPAGAEETKAPGTEAAATSAPKTEAPTTKAVATDAPKTESPGTEAPKTAAPKTAAPKTEAPTTEAPVEDEGDRLKRENEALRTRVNELSKPKEQLKTAAPKTSAPSTEAPVEVINFLKDLDIDELTRSPEEFNKLLNVVYSKGLGASEKAVIEKVLRSLPDIVKTNIVTINSLIKSSEQFYEDNKDLVPFKKIVSLTFEEVAAENPDKKYNELFEDVAKKAREKLELVKSATKDVKKENKDVHPTLPHRKGQPRRTTGKPSTTPIESEIDAMNESLDS